MPIRRTTAGIKSVGAAARGAGNDLITRFTSGLKLAATAMALAAIAAVAMGSKLNASAEQTDVAFTTMLQSAVAAKRVLGELDDFAASTPFQLGDLQDGAKQLLQAQVPTSQLTNKLRMLGDIAAGTGKSIEDVVQIYAKVKATGKVSLETLNQLAERGVPIYTALGKQLGVSRTEMLDMIGSGKVGFNDLDAAIESTTTGAGVFAGAMEKQSETIAGLQSTLKNNILLTLKEIGAKFATAFDVKGGLENKIAFFQKFRAKIEEIGPAITGIAENIKSGFSLIKDLGISMMTSLGAMVGYQTGHMMEDFLTFLAIGKFVFSNLPEVAQLGFMKIQLYAIQLFGAFTHFFTTKLPSYIAWFGDNWQDVLTTAFDYAATVFINVGNNIKNMWSAVLDFIAGNGFEFDWTPLTEGAVNAIKELPDIPDRVIGRFEKSLWTAGLWPLEAYLLQEVQQAGLH
jgi:tape measure domain-containing protein